MQEIATSREKLEASPETDQPSRRGRVSRRSVVVGLLLLGLVLLAVLPPLINVNRFKRRIVTSISASLGRPVHLDSVSLVMLPLPGFKLDNFVVAEDSAFGAEPVIHANNVQATLRFSSLWRRKIEFSRISLREPSINLVHNAQGNWNIEGILLQAARISAAPTAQSTAGPEPRFPYIEATDARVNVKEGIEKLPLSLTEADFALWLPSPQRWRVRVQGKPTRTDTSSSDTGRVSLEGTLARAEQLDLIPIDLSAEWRNVPLGEASRLINGRDAGLRGDLRLNLRVTGTVGFNLVKASLDLRGARKADFVPEHPLDVRAECQADAASSFHAFHQIRCSWPPPTASALLALTGDIPDIHRRDSATFELGTPGLPGAVLLNWLSVASARIPPELIASGALTGSASVTSNGWNGRLELKDAALAGGVLGNSPVKLAATSIEAAAATSGDAHSLKKKHVGKSNIVPGDAPGKYDFVMAPTRLDLGAKEPATLEGRFDRSGYTLRLVGNVLPSRLLALGAAIPQFGDGLASLMPQPGKEAPPHVELPLHVDFTSTRPWNGGQKWSRTAALIGPARHR